MPSDVEGSTVIRHNFDGFPGPADDDRLDRHPVDIRKGVLRYPVRLLAIVMVFFFWQVLFTDGTFVFEENSAIRYELLE